MDLARRRAERRALWKISFLGHALVWAVTCVFLSVVASPFVGLIVALSWGIGLASHGFFFVVAPELRRRWVDKEVGVRVNESVTDERRALEGRHARSLEQLSASVAHEIRNPITAAKSLAQQIAEDPTSQTNAELAKVAVEELDRVERSVSHLLRYAREEPLKLAQSHVDDVVESALESLKERIGRSPVRIERNADGDGHVEADADKLRRVFINLVSNAIDALEESGFPDPCVEISSGENLAGDDLWIRVRDNGPGIESERLGKIFDPFHTSKEKGTGLGLAITRKLVEAHGGTIEVESALGAGTTFSITLPKKGARRAR